MHVHPITERIPSDRTTSSGKVGVQADIIYYVRIFKGFRLSLNKSVLVCPVEKKASNPYNYIGTAGLQG